MAVQANKHELYDAAAVFYELLVNQTKTEEKLGNPKSISELISSQNWHRFAERAQSVQNVWQSKPLKIAQKFFQLKSFALPTDEIVSFFVSQNKRT